MSYTEKIDVLELLIGILQDHEKKLGEITERLESLNILKRGNLEVVRVYEYHVTEIVHIVFGELPQQVEHTHYEPRQRKQQWVPNYVAEIHYADDCYVKHHEEEEDEEVGELQVGVHFIPVRNRCTKGIPK